MKKMTGLLAGLAMLLAMALAVNVSFARESTKKKAEVGKPAPQFTLTDVVTGKEISLADYKDKIVVMTFQSINCPWDRDRPEAGYQRVLSPLSKEWKDKGVAFIAVNSNYNESSDAVGSYAKENQIPYPILKDSGNVVADEYGGRTTPHFYVIDNDKDQTLLYMGGYEKAPNTPEQCGKMDEQYLVPVVTAVLEGKETPYTVTKSKGCGIKRQK
ncbi:redoxin domain-containing protein [Poriferisphaera sp. WC338]|uniref:redoxin domain-containing protein n=1 Tax=Poriferisphaera sp. WC338 TaxID=3425129 RepID=UPI003D81A896